MTGVVHGGRLDRAIARFGGLPEDWSDLSTGINPWPWPIPDLAPRSWARLPDGDAVAATVEAAREYYGAPADAHVAVANGSQAIIQALPLCRGPSRVVVVGATYREHEHCWALAGHDVIAVPDLASVPGAAEVVVLVNPNNPDGRVVEPDDLRDWAGRLDQRGGVLVVDEAFCDIAPSASVAASTGHPGLCVLRSFGKFFGLAGARIGFALCDGVLGARLEARLGPWATSGPALAIATRALGDRKWVATARQRLAIAATALRGLLRGCGLEVVGGTDLFILVECPDAGRLWHDLCAHRILTRRFPEDGRRLRIGLPSDAHTAERLREAVGSFMNAPQ